MPTKTDSEEEDVEKQSPGVTVDGVVTNSHTSRSYLRSLSHISESSADGIVLMDRSVGESGEVMSLTSGISINDIEMEIPNRSPEPSQLGGSVTDVSPRRLCVIQENTTANDVTDQQPIIKRQDTSSSGLTSSSPRTEGRNPNTQSQFNTHPHLECSTPPESGDVTYVARRVLVVEEMTGAGADYPSKESDGPGDSGLEDALGVVVSSLDDYRGQFPELQLLEQEVKLLQVTLKVRMLGRNLLNIDQDKIPSLYLSNVIAKFTFI